MEVLKIQESPCMQGIHPTTWIRLPGDIFAPVAKMTSIRLLFSIAAQHKMKISHFDFETAFLNGWLEEELYMRLPQEAAALIQLSIPDYQTEPVRLLKSLYGLKQAGRCWNRELDKHLHSIGFSPLKADPCIYTRINNENDKIYIGVYVDDCLVVSSNSQASDELFKALKSKYSVKDFGRPSQFLGMEINYKDDGSIHLSQKRYIGDLLKKYDFETLKPSKTPYISGQKLESNPTQDGKPEQLSDKPYAELVGSLN